jgi:hypothetical protein
MKGREKQTRLKVVKTDGSVEQYFHTKVLGTICNALAGAGQADATTAENLAEAVTYFLYHRDNGETVTSCEIFSIIKAVLSATGYEEAALTLSDHHHHRRVKRGRVEVLYMDIEKLSDAEMLYGLEKPVPRKVWDKSKIACDLVDKHKIPRLTARAVASMVEEKILNMGLNLIPASVVKQLVLSDTAALLNAQRQLQPA